MGTRSTISILKADGTVNSVYCASDGYLAHNGVKLYKYYKDAETVNDLIEKGAVYFLLNQVNPPEGFLHNADNRVPGVTVFFHRDMPDQSLDIDRYPSLENFLKSAPLEDFNYIFKETEENWFAILNDKNYVKKLELLKEEFKKDYLIPEEDRVQPAVSEHIIKEFESEELADKLEKILPSSKETPFKKPKL